MKGTKKKRKEGKKKKDKFMSGVLKLKGKEKNERTKKERTKKERKRKINL